MFKRGQVEHFLTIVNLKLIPSLFTPRPTVRPCIASQGIAPSISHRLYSVVRRFTCPCTLVRSSNWSPLGPAALVFLALPIASSTSSHVIGYLRPLFLARGTGFHLILNGGILVELSLSRNSLSFHSWGSGTGCLCASQIFCWLALLFHVYSTCFVVSCIRLILLPVLSACVVGLVFLTGRVDFLSLPGYFFAPSFFWTFLLISSDVCRGLSPFSLGWKYEWSVTSLATVFIWLRNLSIIIWLWNALFLGCLFLLFVYFAIAADTWASILQSLILALASAFISFLIVQVR